MKDNIIKSPFRVSRFHMNDLETAYLNCKNKNICARFDALQRDPGFWVVDNPLPGEILHDFSYMFMYPHEIIDTTESQQVSLIQKDQADDDEDTRCQACKDGDCDLSISCGFTLGLFDGAYNYRCATVNQIRELIENDLCIQVTRRDDQNYTTLYVGDIKELSSDDQPDPICLWVGWYKQRGRTEGMWLLFEHIPPRPPTEKECLAIIKHWTQKH